MPITTRPSSSTWKRRLEKGTRSSANQPSSVTSVATSQKVLKLELIHPPEAIPPPLASFEMAARLQVSAPLLDLWRSLGEERVFYWRLFAARKLGLPRDYVELEKALGQDAFSLDQRSGVVVTSPFAVRQRSLRRFGVLLSARSRGEVDEMDRLVRNRFEK